MLSYKDLPYYGHRPVGGLSKDENIAAIFDKVYNGQKNGMTPNILGHGITGNGYVWELSYGQGLFGDTLYGVTILSAEHNKTDMNKSFSSVKEAINYVQSLEEDYADS